MGDDLEDITTQSLLALEPLQVLSDDAVFVGSQVSAPAALAESTIRTLRSALVEARRDGAKTLRNEIARRVENLMWPGVDPSRVISVMELAKLIRALPLPPRGKGVSDADV